MKKYNGIAWVDTTLRQYKTATDTITTLPVDIYADGNNATVGISGNTVQNGTPIPARPVDVQGVGTLDNGQYKISILNNSQTTNVYLGEVQSTRRIYKYEFTGSETWSDGTENYYSFVPQIHGEGVRFSAVICSHCSNAIINNTGNAVFFKKTDFPDITTSQELKQYCADQYANGTPITIWYVLAESTTGIINEPLMKIGDYADEVSNVSIPTIAGINTLSVDTTVQPSEVTVNYKGWHAIANVHERESGVWT